MSDKNNHSLNDAIRNELVLAESLENSGDLNLAFHHLERAHVLGQASTYEHTRIHWRMFKIAIKQSSLSEVWGQIIRIIGALTKTPLGIYPKGNTGGSDVWFFKTMSIPEDLRRIIAEK
ncbi:MAG TPA: DUF3703 domain-containing protein [Pyrinomonadaceae bacterium]|nr:DUF3703 domain-containing protein [Acidobacteriota bacterium]HMM78841.1 DUF3703 domain-containing protein [Pyrinomonadaceae bacterium]